MNNAEKQNIIIKGVLAEINKPNNVFSIKFRRKSDGYISSKQNVTRLQTSGSTLTDRRKMNRSGVVKLYHLETQQDFDCVIDFIREFNGKKVIF